MVVYRTSPYIQTLYAFFLRIAYLCIIIFAIMHYRENPFVVSIVSLICFIFFLVTGKEEIIIFPDAIKYKNSSIIRIFEKRRVFVLADIADINVSGIFNTGDELYNPAITKEKPLNDLKIELKNGKNVIIKTSIYINELKKVEAEVKRMIKHNSV